MSDSFPKSIELKKRSLHERIIVAKVLLESVLDELPPIEPELRPISYLDCSNVMLKMWMDNVVTDGEYNRIMDKLNKKHEEDMRGENE